MDFEFAFSVFEKEEYRDSKTCPRRRALETGGGEAYG